MGPHCLCTDGRVEVAKGRWEKKLEGLGGGGAQAKCHATASVREAVIVLRSRSCRYCKSLHHHFQILQNQCCVRCLLPFPPTSPTPFGYPLACHSSSALCEKFVRR